jgi:cytochrome c oxidase subunit 2
VGDGADERMTGSRRITLLCLGATVLLTACEQDSPSALAPGGPGAARIAGLWWVIFWVATVIFLIVVGFLAVAVLRGRRSEVRVERDIPWGERFIVIAGVVIPSLILTGVFVLSQVGLPTTARDDSTLTIEVLGRLWWWEARYPNGVVTANEIHIPTDQPVRFKLLSDDAIHSFWVPRLHGKVDHIPGRVNYLTLEADEPGWYRGQCAEFCGLEHAKMAFYVVAHPREEFQSWLEEQARPAEDPEGVEAAGERVFLTTTCAGCHAVAGTPADADLGPDLTHIDSRRTLAAGTILNTRANMAEWITNPRAIKPGSLMPPTELTTEQLEALLDYLESLD